MAPIVGIGEILWDIYPDGRKVAGGAPFNFAFHCHQLGHDAVIVSRVGDDDLGRDLREEVRRLGLTGDFIQTDRAHPTGTVMVTLDKNKVPSYTITDDVAWDYIEWNDSLIRLHQVVRSICFGSLAARTAMSRNSIERFISPWSENVDPELIVFDINLRPGVRTDFTSFVQWGIGNTDWVKLNESELKSVGNWCGAIEPTVRDTFSGNQVVIVTRGIEGCDVFAPDSATHEPGVPANVVDTVGAGDAFTAAMVCLHLEGRTLRDCARFANHYAARVCEFQGATPRIDRAEVERAAFAS